MKIAVGCDHAGLVLMRSIREFLAAEGFVLLDHGTHDEASVDYPDFAHAVAISIEKGEADLGVLVCGTGIGVSIAANRHSRVRAALCTDSYMARMSRMHNNANVLCLGARVIGVGTAFEIVKTFMTTVFEGGRHEQRIEKIEIPS